MSRVSLLLVLAALALHPPSCTDADILNSLTRRHLKFSEASHGLVKREAVCDTCDVVIKCHDCDDDKGNNVVETDDDKETETRTKTKTKTKTKTEATTKTKTRQKTSIVTQIYDNPATDSSNTIVELDITSDVVFVTETATDLPFPTDVQTVTLTDTAAPTDVATVTLTDSPPPEPTDVATVTLTDNQPPADITTTQQPTNVVTVTQIDNQPSDVATVTLTDTQVIPVPTETASTGDSQCVIVTAP
jgi:hypothetical protein